MRLRHVAYAFWIVVKLRSCARLLLGRNNTSQYFATTGLSQCESIEAIGISATLATFLPPPQSFVEYEMKVFQLAKSIGSLLLYFAWSMVV